MVTATNVTFLTVAIYLLDLGIKIVALGLVPEGPPSSATAWLLLILFLPIIGLLAFWLIGSPFVDRGRPAGCRRRGDQQRTHRGNQRSLARPASAGR
jgi:RsiW-degrading membrane proteinase PrsW (M82 family)